MKDKVQKANSVLLGLFVTCGLGLTAANLRKAVADSSGGSSSSGCAMQIGSDNCPDGFQSGYPVQLSGTACGTVNSYDCCLYNRWRRDCTSYLTDDDPEVIQKYYNVLVGPNHYKDCQQGRCVAFPSSGGSSSGGSSSGGSSSGGSSSGGSSSGGSSSGGSSYASNSAYYFQA